MPKVEITEGRLVRFLRRPQLGKGGDAHPCPENAKQHLQCFVHACALDPKAFLLRISICSNSPPTAEHVGGACQPRATACWWNCRLPATAALLTQRERALPVPIFQSGSSQKLRPRPTAEWLSSRHSAPSLPRYRLPAGDWRRAWGGRC